MTLEIIRLTLGPLSNNVYLLGDPARGDAVVIDPSFEAQALLECAESWADPAGIWLTTAILIILPVLARSPVFSPAPGGLASRRPGLVSTGRRCETAGMSIRRAAVKQPLPRHAPGLGRFAPVAEVRHARSR